LISAGGLIDVNAGTPANVSTTGFEVQLNTPFGGVTSPIPAEGLGLADFEVFNNTASASVTITSVTESSVTEGLYTFVIPAQTAADELIVTNTSVSPLTKNFDLNKFTVTIP